MEDFIINFHITEGQARAICEHYDKDFSQIEEYEICEMLDKIIDEL